MIQHLKTILQRTFKLILWITGSVILLLLCLAIFIQIPAVQNALIHRATTYFSNKTHAEIRVRKIALSFPTCISLQDVLVKDLFHDTLLKAGEIKVTADMLCLFKKEVVINNVFLSETFVHLKRAENDSTFNFNFLITAFSGPPKKKQSKDTAATANNFTVKSAGLENVRFIYDDKHGGIYTAYTISQLNLTVKELDINALRFVAGTLVLSGMEGNVTILKNSGNSSSAGNPHPHLPFAAASSIEIKKSIFSFIDRTSSQSVTMVINDIVVKDPEVDLNLEKIRAELIFIGQSNVRVNLTRNEKSQSKKSSEPITNSKERRWSVSVKKIELENNGIGYNIVNAPLKKERFDENHINYSKISLSAKDLFYSLDKMNAAVLSFSASDPTSFEVHEFSTKFFMDYTSIKASDLKLKTRNSSFHGDAGIGFTSLSSIKDSIQKLQVSANIVSSSVYPPEILYFAPQLIYLSFFKSNAQTAVSGSVSGTIGNLAGKHIKIRTGSFTALNTNFVINGLPDFKTSFFDIHDLALVSGQNDIIKLAGKENIPKSIVIPEQLSLKGRFKGYLKEFVAELGLQSTFGDLEISGGIDKKENYKATLQTRRFDLGKLLNNEMLGPATLKADINGSGLDTETVKANVKLHAPEFYLNKYTYHNLEINGNFSKKIFEGKTTINDSNIVLKLDGYVNLNTGQEQYKVNLDLEGADLKKLNLTERDLKIGFLAVSDIRGGNMNSINGTAGVTRIIIASKGQKYVLDSLIFAAINEPGKSEMTLRSAIVDIKYKGTFAPGDLVKELKHNLNIYFPIEQEITPYSQLKGPQQFSFDVTVNNHPILSQVFFPDLREFEPGTLRGSFNSEKKQLQLQFSIDRFIYKTTDLTGLAFDASSDNTKLAYKLAGKKIATSLFEFDNVLINGKLENGEAFTGISSTEDNGNKKLVINTVIKKERENYKLSIDPREFFLMNEQWRVTADNYISFGKEGLLVHEIDLKKDHNEIYINTPSEKPGGDIEAGLKNFDLDDLSRIIEKDTGLVKGRVNGSVILHKINNAYGFRSDLVISDMSLHDIPVGKLSLKADNAIADKYTVSATLSGSGNEVNAKGSYNPGSKDQNIDMELVLQPLTAKALEAFSFGKIREATGNLYGNFSVKGNVTIPEVTGSLKFEDVTLTPAILNSKLYLKSETIKIQPDGLYFNSFTMLDKDQNPAIVNGAINMKQFRDYTFALSVNTSNFLLLNTTAKDNDQYFGKMIVDSRIRVRGTLDYPVINSAIKLKNGSYFTFAVTENKLTTDKGESVVLFVDSMKFSPILTRNENKEKKKSTLKNFDISSTIEIDKKASIRLMLDPGSNDSLVVRGDAALSFGLDPSGKVSLTGVYNLSEGSYVVSLENVIKKKFKIQPGSTISWNGDPLDALININATYYIRTSPVDLVAGQVSSTELGAFRQRYAFLVLLKLRGAILAPDISFEIQLQQSDKGAANGTINAKLEQLNDNPSALNKQVFALLVLSRFIQENPLQTETDAPANAARTTVGKFLSTQLNQLSSKVAPGVDINFDVQSYDDYSSGRSQGRTQVGVGVSKQLFNERLSVQVGGAVDVEGEKAKQNTATDITGDVIIEYKITKDGRYRLKGFRNNQYQGALEGQIIQTGAGILYVRDFNEWIQLFLKEKKDTTTNSNTDFNVQNLK